MRECWKNMDDFSWPLIKAVATLQVMRLCIIISFTHPSHNTLPSHHSTHTSHTPHTTASTHTSHNTHTSHHSIHTPLTPQHTHLTPHTPTHTHYGAHNAFLTDCFWPISMQHVALVMFSKKGLFLMANFHGP